MKKTAILLTACCLSLFAGAQENHSEVSEASIEVTKTPSNGVEVLCSPSKFEGNDLATIQFTNTTKKAITFIWKVELKNGATIISSEEITLRPGKSRTIKNAFEMKGSLNPVDFPIILMTK